MFKRALVSVSDKTGLIEFLKPLVNQGLQVVSSGGTAKYLRENSIQVIDVSEVTNFPEVLDGRVKTLHPNIHMGLLARVEVESHRQALKEFNIEPFDLVIVNLYPFDKVSVSARLDEKIELIDVGGPTMLRAAAKNFKSITVVTSPADYGWISERSGRLTLADRQELAAKVFYHTASYDAMIAKSLTENVGVYHATGGEQIQELRYGENPHQKALWYKERGAAWGLHQAAKIQGKELSYNNLLDLHSAVGLIRELDGFSTVVVKHNNPCGVARGGNELESVDRALKADPVSAFGGIVACGFKIDKKSAERFNELFLECIIAPGFSDEAKAILGQKKNLRVLEWPQMFDQIHSYEWRSIYGGYLAQSFDKADSWSEDWEVVGETPDPSIKLDLIFASKCAMALKSNAIAIVLQGQTLGLGMGQVNRVEAMQQAIQRMHHHHPHSKNPILASDAFFPFPDSIELAGKAGIKWIIQPGGSVNDSAVLEAALKLKINMVITKTRHFRH